MHSAPVNLNILLQGHNFSSIGNINIEITSICYDSRMVKPGALFVCIPGLKADGHSFATKAVQQGAVALVVEHFLDLPVSQVKVKDSRQALGLLAAAFYHWPSDSLRLIGITGTNGKTTITYLLEHVLRRAAHNIGLIGTLGARIGETEFPGTRTTPEASDLQGLLATMVQRQAEYVVMEVSSHALELHRTSGCEYDVAVFTNLTQDHLDFHQTMEQYLAAKAKLLAGLDDNPRKQGRKYAVINADDAAAPELCAKTTAKVLTYGLQAGAVYRAVNVQNTAAGVSFEVVYPGGTLELKLQTPGLFTVYNALAAFAVGIEEQLDPSHLAIALSEMTGVPGRFETVSGKQPFNVIVDYAHTPDGLENVLKTARGFCQGKVIAVFGCGGDRDKTKRPVMGRIAGSLADVAIVTSDNPRTEQPNAIIADIIAGIKEITQDFITEPDRGTAINLACAMADKGDLVLIAGKGHEDYQEICGIKYPFDDREVARACLERMGYGKDNA
ncbi:MAG: UDP-N-acetylmuramoyl-L-alanyl-D-glutamate--2,6-diaminopimelate ligase [Peptococcaceae bacterium]|nr:UDP-N-acetylmuramoyl-L-alanyl-D-glutamate--2,6-diaminopimelate ligase [Peptococcaceae bacterium]